MSIKIGFIGTGNMGAPLIRGVIRSSAAQPGDIYIYDVDESKAGAIAEDTGVQLAAGNAELVSACDYIVLAVKPVYIKSVLEEIKESFTNQKVLISIAVGVSSKTLGSVLGENAKIVRTMPNLPVLVGEGMTLVCFDNKISEQEKIIVRSLFEGSGMVEELEERLMSEVTSVTSSSPAYVFMMLEAMADGAVQQGIPRGLAYRLASQAVLGAAKMVIETGLHPAQLKDQVCSPAGTTIEAVKTLEKNAFRHTLIEAMEQCTKRALEIGRESENR